MKRLWILGLVVCGLAHFSAKSVQAGGTLVATGNLRGNCNNNNSCGNNGGFNCSPRSNCNFGYGGCYPSYYGYGGYSGFYSDYGSPTIINNYYFNAPANPGTPVTDLPSVPVAPRTELPPPQPQAQRANIDVHLPAAAELWVQGVKMNLTGPTRRFVTPALDARDIYDYEFRVRWTENGREITRTRTLSVKVGDFQSVRFLSAGPAPDEVADRR